jgi:hypothetical protein
MESYMHMFCWSIGHISATKHICTKQIASFS